MERETRILLAVTVLLLALLHMQRVEVSYWADDTQAMRCTTA